MKFRWLTDLLFPPHVRCAFCGEENHLVKPYDLCLQCMEQLSDEITVQNGLATAFPYEDPISSVIQRFKYNGQRYLASTLACFLADTAKKVGFLSQPVDAVIPVPLYKKKQRERGYNQSILLAREFCGQTQLPFSNLLCRNINTPSQTNLTAQQRIENVKGAFSVCRPVAGKRILLIDDVTTTGATLHECRATLLSAGAFMVNCLCVAHALFKKR
ncbi:MAG: ComF family protein [Christensenellales bacterium]